MKAVVLTRKGNAHQAFEIQDYPKPKPVNGEVLIKVEAFGLNFADVMARQGLYREAPPMPCVVGYEVVGKVTGTGNDVGSELVGERVVAFTRFGGYAVEVVTDARAVVPIQDMNAGKALALSVQYCTAMHCVNKAAIRAGGHVLVHAAAGGVGVALIQLLKRKSCVIYGTAGSDEKLDFIRSQGVPHAINYRKQDYSVELTKLLGSQKLDASFNAVGGKSFKKDMSLTGAGGTVVCFGAADRSGRSGGFFANLKLLFGMGFLHPLFLMMKSQTVVGVNMLRVAEHQPEVLQETMQQVVILAKEGAIDPYVGAEFGVDEIGAAHELLESRNSMGKIIVKW